MVQLNIPAQGAPVGLTPEQMGQLRTHNTAMLAGQLFAVLSSSPRHRAMTLAEVQERYVPAMVAGQLLIGHAAVPNAPGESFPCAAVFVAMVDAETDARLAAATGPTPLEGKAWTSGDNAWIVDWIGFDDNVAELVRVVETQMLKGRVVKRVPAPAAEGRA